MFAIGMQMEAVVMASPDRADVIGLFQHDNVEPAARIVTAHASPAGPAPTMIASRLAVMPVALSVIASQRVGANGRAKCAPDDRLREAIQMLRRPKSWIASSLALLAMTEPQSLALPAMTPALYLPHNLFRDIDREPQLRPLLFLGEDVTPLRSSEAALRRNRELIQGHEFGCFFQPTPLMSSFFSSSPVFEVMTPTTTILLPFAIPAAARSRRRVRNHIRGNSRRSWCRPAWSPPPAHNRRTKSRWSGNCLRQTCVVMVMSAGRSAIA